MAKSLVLAAGMLAAALTGCFGSGVFNCATNDQCNAAGGQGVCQDNLCAYADTSCGSGLRYGESSGDVSNQCVGASGGDGPAGRVCFGADNGLVKPCFPSAPTGDVSLPAMVNTDDGSPDCASNVTEAPGVCVIAGERVRVENTVSVSGGRPLVLVAAQTIDISGTLDAASHRSGGSQTMPYTHAKTGPGSGPATGCTMGAAPGTSGGGAGGTMAGLGGVGGNGGGMPPVTAEDTTRLRGGCPGQNGNTGVIGEGGRGGGAVYLIAVRDIQISGAINASGEGGHPGVDNAAGGGGGGSGGMIGFDAPMIMNTGVVFANGGSGGEGSGNDTIGNPGNEANSAAPAPAPLSGSNGGAGGSMGGTANGAMGLPSPTYGGGGGGGGVGVIRVLRGVTLGGEHSPPQS